MAVSCLGQKKGEGEIGGRSVRNVWISCWLGQLAFGILENVGLEGALGHAYVVGCLGHFT